MAKMTDWVPKERLGTSEFNDVFLKICPYDPTLKFQELEIGCDWTSTKSNIEICKTNSSQTKKMWNFAYFENSSKSDSDFFKILALNAIHPYISTVKISSWVVR